MLVFPLCLPGTWLDSEDREWRYEINCILDELKSSFFEANTCLNLFNDEMLKSQQEMSGAFYIQEMQDDRDKLEEIKKEIIIQKSIGSYDFLQEVDEIARIALKEDKWRKGVEPYELRFRKKFIYAKSFLYCFDTIQGLLKVLGEQRDVPPGISDAQNLMKDSFPHLRSVRNSAHHIEDRALGLKQVRGKKVKIELQPVNTGSIKADVGIILSCQLNGTRLGYTMDNGFYGEIDVSSDSMTLVQTVIQSVFNSFTWIGPSSHLPV